MRCGVRFISRLHFILIFDIQYSCRYFDGTDAMQSKVESPAESEANYNTIPGDYNNYLNIYDNIHIRINR